MIVKVRCDICFETVAQVDTTALRLPLRGAMFSSPDPLHGFPDPFHPSLDWEGMRCPYGAHRPFVSEDVITCLNEGEWLPFVVPGEVLPIVPADKTPPKPPEKLTLGKKRRGWSKAHRMIMGDK